MKAAGKGGQEDVNSYHHYQCQLIYWFNITQRNLQYSLTFLQNLPLDQLDHL